MTISRKPGALRARALTNIMLGVCTAFATAAVAAEPPSPAADEVNEVTGFGYEYLWIAGSAFHPLDNSTTFTYQNGGCISKTGGPGTPSSLFTHKAILPDGAVVRYLRSYYFDDSASQIIAFLTTYDGKGNFNQRTEVESTNTGAYGSSLSPVVNYEVDQLNSALNVTVNMGTQNDSTLRFCGARIAYDAPITDVIFADSFDFIPL